MQNLTSLLMQINKEKGVTKSVVQLANKGRAG